MSDLVHIVYISFSVVELNENELEDLLKDIRNRNKLHNITGLLLYNKTSFIQVIEGERNIIDSVFNKIKQDDRHSNIVLLIEESIKHRSFPDWSMGYRLVSPSTINQIKGYSDFLNSNNSDLIKGSTKEVIHLLYNFKKHT